MPRCKGKTARGGRCKLRCPPGSVYCWHHGSNVMRGWHDKAKSIRRRSSRHAMADRCGARECFLEPGQLKYPVCPPHSCEPSCQGIAAARARALILHRKDLVNKADRLAKKLGMSSSSTATASIADEKNVSPPRDETAPDGGVEKEEVCLMATRETANCEEGGACRITKEGEEEEGESCNGDVCKVVLVDAKEAEKEEEKGAKEEAREMTEVKDDDQEEKVSQVAGEPGEDGNAKAKEIAEIMTQEKCAPTGVAHRAYLHCTDPGKPGDEVGGRPSASKHAQGQMLLIVDRLYWNVLDPKSMRQHWVSCDKPENVKRVADILKERMVETMKAEKAKVAQIIGKTYTGAQLRAWLLYNLAAHMPLGLHVVRLGSSNHELYLTVDPDSGARQWVDFSPAEVKALKKIFLRETGLEKLPQHLKVAFNQRVSF